MTEPKLLNFNFYFFSFCSLFVKLILLLNSHTTCHHYTYQNFDLYGILPSQISNKASLGLLSEQGACRFSLLEYYSNKFGKKN